MTVPLYNLTDTWNNGATVFTAIQMNVTNTASAAGSLLMDLQVAGNSVFNVALGQVNLTSGGVTSNLIPTNSNFSIGWNNTAKRWWFNNDGIFYTDGIGMTSGGQTTLLVQDANYIFAQRNLANAQTFRVYNTTDAGNNNYERAIIDWTTTANVLTIGTEAGGTGSPRSLQFKAKTSVGAQGIVLDYGVSYGTTWTIPANSQMSFEGAQQGVVYIRAGASNYGEIGNINSTTWMLGYIAATPSNGLGTEVVSWTNLDSVVCNHHAIATNATDGFLYIATCAGTPTGTPTTFTGRVPMVYDTTNNKFYIYNGGWKGGTNPGVFT